MNVQQISVLLVLTVLIVDLSLGTPETLNDVMRNRKLRRRGLNNVVCHYFPQFLRFLTSFSTTLATNPNQPNKGGQFQTKKCN